MKGDESSTLKLLFKYYKRPTKTSNNSINYYESINKNNLFRNNSNIMNSNNSLNNNRYNTLINSCNELTQDYSIDFQPYYPYNNLENPYPPRIMNIKMCFYIYLVEKRKLNLTLDAILLYKCTNNKYQLINDDDYFYSKKISSSKTKISTISKNNINDINSNVFYYSIDKNKINIIVEMFSNNIDKISFSLSRMCSLFLIKFLIVQKLKLIEKTKEITQNVTNEKNIVNLMNESDNTIKINEIEKDLKLYGNGIINNNNSEYVTKKETNRNFSNSSILNEIYNYYTISNIPSLISVNCVIKKNSFSKINDKDNILSFILMENKSKKCHLGLDFRFTILQYFTPISNNSNNEFNINDFPINFNKIKNNNSANNNGKFGKNNNIFLDKNRNSSKSNDSINKSTNNHENNSNNIALKEISENYPLSYGMNLYFNCTNINCIYNKKCFCYNIGYGNFDIFNLINYIIECPNCLKKKVKLLNNINENEENESYENNIFNLPIELKYIAMMNSKWVYKGFLQGIKTTVVEGKGMTMMNNILYITKEFDFSHQFKSLLFQIEKYFSKNDYNQNSNNTINSLNDDTLTNESNVNESKNNIDKINLNNKIAGFKISTIASNGTTTQNETGKNINLNNINFTNNNNNNCTNNISNFNNVTNIEDVKNDNGCLMNMNLNNNNYYFNTKNKNLYKQMQYKYRNNLNIYNKKLIDKNTRQNNHNQENNIKRDTNDFNIIIDKTKTKCCDSCINYEQVSQVCEIF